MLDKVIHNHLDSMEKIETELEKDIDKIFSSVGIEEYLKDPREGASAVTTALRELLVTKYAPLAIKHGQTFAKLVKKDGEIQVPAGKDPKQNEGITDDNRSD